MMSSLKRLSCLVMLFGVTLVAPVSAETASVGAASPQSGAPALTRQYIEQKLAMANQMLYKSAGAKRVDEASDDSTHVAAKGILDEARVYLESAKVALQTNSLTEADDLAGEAMRRAGIAFRLLPDVAKQAEQQRLRYSRLSDELKTFLDSKLVTAASANPPELEQIRDAMVKAKALADKNRYDDANQILVKARDSVNTAIGKLMVTRTISYEIKFESPKEEYEYELHRHQSIADLMPLAIADYKPSKEALSQIEEVVKKAKSLQAASEKEAAGGDYTAAMKTLKQATHEIYNAMELAGLVVPR
jgi:hypothetical protein